MSALLRSTRRVSDVWTDLLNAMDQAVAELDDLGEYEQAAALRVDADYLHQRSLRHIRNVSKAND